MWPPASPDLNQMDFLVRSLLKVKIVPIAHPSALQTSLLSEWAKIPQETMRASVGNFT